MKTPSLALALAFAASCSSPTNPPTDPAVDPTTDPRQDPTHDGSDADPGVATPPPPDASSPPDAGSIASCAALLTPGNALSKWVHPDPTGKLVYATLPKGDHILDFSNAGYGGGGVAIPAFPISATLHPSGGPDDTPAIQAALDTVSKAPLTNGIRGAVLLAPGTFNITGSLSIHASGVALLGSGKDKTTINATGSARTIFAVSGTGAHKTVGTRATILDDYVPSGSRTFHVQSTAGFSVGTAVLVQRPVTAAWVHFMGMDTLVRNGAPQTWLKEGTLSSYDRIIENITGNEITVDAPLPDSLDKQFVSPPGASMVAYTFDGRISNVGIQGMTVVVPPSTVPLNQASFLLFTMNNVVDGWLSNVAAKDFSNGLSIGGGSKRVTVEDTSFARTAPIDGSAGYPGDFGISGEQILLQRCASQGDHIFSFVTQALVQGPNVVLDMTATGTSTNMSPHQRWATGLLLDGIESPTGGISLTNRGSSGSGQGWAIGFGVVWNATTKALDIRNPPGSQNWVIGSMGALSKQTQPESVDSQGAAVTRPAG